MMASKIGIIAVVAVLAFTGFAFASPPVPPPAEGFGIITSCDVTVDGTFIEDENFVWTWVADTMDYDRGNGSDLAGQRFLATGGRAGEIRYANETTNIDGLTQFVKSFQAMSHTDEPNVSVSKDYGFVASETSLVTLGEDWEAIGLSIVANGDTAGLNDMPSLCPWAHEDAIPATNEFIASSNQSETTAVLVTHSDSSARGTTPPNLIQTYSGTGIGMMRAEMRVRLQEGSGVWDPSATLADPQFQAVPELVSTTTYDEVTMASGVIEEFSKNREYFSVIPAFQMPQPWFMVLPD